jgi:hypothetical protein
VANRGPEVELLRGGTSLDAPSKGSVVLNMSRRQNAWEVRKGFGQLAQIDTLMSGWMLSGSATEPAWRLDNGYRRVVGSSLIKTKQGNRQIVTVIASSVRVGAVVADPRSIVESTYHVSIYDVDTGGRWEEPVYRHTSEITPPVLADAATTYTGDVVQIGNDSNITNHHGAFETTQSKDYASFTRSSLDEDSLKQVWFSEINDILYFGNEDIGLCAYLPVSLRKMRRRQLNTQYRGTRTGAVSGASKAYGHGAAPPYSECSFIKRVPAGEPSSVKAASYAYLDGAAFPKPAVGCRAGGALVLATGANIYVTDGGFPGSIKALNAFVLATDQAVTAMAFLSGNLYAFTKSETWLIQLSPGAVSTLGRTIKVSDGVGCSGPGAIVKKRNSICWSDSRGVYQMTGVAKLERISDPIEPFFTDELSSPLNNYFTDNGHVDATQVHADDGWPTPRSFYRHSSDMVTAAYNEKLSATMFSFPALNAMVVYTGGQWAVWPLESIAKEEGTTPRVGALDNIKRPMVMADETDVFVTCGIERQLMNSGTAAGPQYDGYNNSICHLRYGRGGGVDRSVEDEDYRTGFGAYVHTEAAAPGGSDEKAIDGGFYFHEPIPIEPGRVFPGTPAVTADTPAYWIPVEMVKPYESIPSGGPATFPTLVNKIALKFTFDNTHWEPIFEHTANGIVNAMFPSERAPSIRGYGHWDSGTASAGTDEFRVYQGGTINPAGNEFRIYWDGAASAPAGYSTEPNMNAAPFRRNRLFYIPMKRKAGAAVNNYTVGFGIQIVLAHITDARSKLVTMGSYVWTGAFVGNNRIADNSKAQPVDWAYKSAQIGMDDDNQHKARGTYTRMLSHGSAAPEDRVSPNWPVGIYNTVVASDFKGWVSQIVDVAPTQTDAAKAVSQVLDTETLRTRYLGSSALSTKVFSANSTGDHVQYGNKNATGTLADTYLVDDEEVDVIAMSNSVKGGHITYMVWGMIRNKAERLVLESVKAVVRKMGGRRRDGH